MYSITHYETDKEYEVTTEEIVKVSELLGIVEEELGYKLTGHSTDTYSDTIHNILKESLTKGGDMKYWKESDEEGYETCRTYHRILNLNLTDTECEKVWLEGCESEVEGMRVKGEDLWNMETEVTNYVKYYMSDTENPTEKEVVIKVEEVLRDLECHRVEYQYLTDIQWKELGEVVVDNIIEEYQLIVG